MDLTQLTFEAAYAELETIVMKLESGELALQESVQLYEVGRTLAQHCQALLDQAELQVTQVGGDL